MITLLEIAGSVVGYVLIGLAWARSQAVRLQKLINKAREYRKKNKNVYGSASRAEDPWFVRGGGGTWEGDLRRGLGLHAGAWPAFMVGRLLSKLNDWTSVPVEKEREAAEKLHKEAENVRKVADATEAPDDKNLLLELAKELLKKAMERDL